MEKLFVPYHIALLLQQLGFIPPMAAAYQTQENNRLIIHWYNKRDFEIAPHLVPAPLYQQVVDWFREKHGLWIEVQITFFLNKQYYVPWIRSKDKLYDQTNKYDYYEAINQAIEDAIKLVNNRNIPA